MDDNGITEINQNEKYLMTQPPSSKCPSVVKILRV